MGREGRGKLKRLLGIRKDLGKQVIAWGSRRYSGEGLRLLRNNTKPWGVSRALVGRSNRGVARPASRAGKDGENGQATKDAGN